MNFLHKYKEFLPEIILSCEKSRLDKLNQFFKALVSEAMPAGMIGKNKSDELLWLRHMLDSVLVCQSNEVVESIQNAGCIYDLGTGAGLPGIPLSILFPEKKFCLVDASLKRTGFVQNQSELLNLKNITLINCRVEDLNIRLNQLKVTGAGSEPSLVMFRAFQKPLVALELSLYALGENGKVLYWRSQPFDSFRDNDSGDAARVSVRTKELGFHQSNFLKLDSPDELGPRGLYLFYHKKPDEKTVKTKYPRKWNRIVKDELANKVI